MEPTNKSFTLSPTIPFKRFLIEVGGFDAHVYFMTTTIREVREASLAWILQGHPHSYGYEWIEHAIDELGTVGEVEFQSQMLEWYVKKTLDAFDPSSVRVFRFLFALSRKEKPRVKLILGLINEMIKLQPRLYWAGGTTDLYLGHFKTMIKTGNWGIYTLGQWETAERYVRRIVEAGDIRYHAFLKEWLDAHKRSPAGLLAEADALHHWDEPNRIKAFLTDAVDRLTVAGNTQKPTQSFAEAMIEYCLYDGSERKEKKYPFTDPFEMKFHYPEAHVVEEAAEAEKAVTVTLQIKDRPEHRRNVLPLKQLMNETDIRLDVEGGMNVQFLTHEDARLDHWGQFNPLTGLMKFSFTPLTKHQRIKLTFRQKGREVGTWVDYFPHRSVHVWA